MRKEFLFFLKRSLDKILDFRRVQDGFGEFDFVEFLLD
jgi:hypothetical protein